MNIIATCSRQPWNKGSMTSTITSNQTVSGAFEASAGTNMSIRPMARIKSYNVRMLSVVLIDASATVIAVQ